LGGPDGASSNDASVTAAAGGAVEDGAALFPRSTSRPMVDVMLVLLIVFMVSRRC
jgi:hypothetical protein